MSKKKIIMGIICVCIVAAWIVFYPLQIYFAQQRMYDYMEKQGIKKENIESRSYRTGLLDTDYYITVKLKDDPNFKYEYFYQPRGGLFNSNGGYFVLSVYDIRTNGTYNVGDKNVPKYIPLAKDLFPSSYPNG